MRKPPANSRPCCCARPAPASKAAPTRSCATSSPSACSACPATSGSTRTCRSTRYRPGDGDEEQPHPEEPREARRLEGWSKLIVRDGASATPHHEDEKLIRDLNRKRTPWIAMTPPTRPRS